MLFPPAPPPPSQFARLPGVRARNWSTPSRSSPDKRPRLNLSPASAHQHNLLQSNIFSQAFIGQSESSVYPVHQSESSLRPVNQSEFSINPVNQSEFSLNPVSVHQRLSSEDEDVGHGQAAGENETDGGTPCEDQACPGGCYLDSTTEEQPSQQEEAQTDVAQIIHIAQLSQPVEQKNNDNESLAKRSILMEPEEPDLASANIPRHNASEDGSNLMEHKTRKREGASLGSSTEQNLEAIHEEVNTVIYLFRKNKDKLLEE